MTFYFHFPQTILMIIGALVLSVLAFTHEDIGGYEQLVRYFDQDYDEQGQDYHDDDDDDEQDHAFTHEDIVGYEQLVRYFDHNDDEQDQDCHDGDDDDYES